MVQPSDLINIPESTVWKKKESSPILPDLHNIESFSLSDINVIKKIVQFISKKGNTLNPVEKDSVVEKLDNQIKEIKKDTSGIINWFRYLFSKNQWKQKQELAYCSEELKNLLQNKPIVPNSDLAGDSSSSNSSSSGSPASSEPPSPVLSGLSSERGDLDSRPGGLDSQPEGLRSLPAEGAALVGAPPPPPPGNGPPPPPPPPGGPPPPGAPIPKAPEKFFLGEPTKEPNPKSEEEIIAYIEGKRNILGIVQASKESPRGGSSRSRNADVAAASKKVSDAREQTFAGVLDTVDTMLPTTRTSSHTTPLKSKAPSAHAKTPSAPAKTLSTPDKTPSTPAKTPAKSEDILKEIKIFLSTLFAKDKDPDLIVRKVENGTIAEKVILMEILEEKLAELKEVEGVFLANLNFSRRKFKDFSRPGNIEKELRFKGADGKETRQKVWFYEKDEDFCSENATRKATGKSLLPDSFLKAAVLHSLKKDVDQDEANYSATIAQMKLFEGLLKTLKSQNNNGILFSEAAKIFDKKVIQLKSWERTLENLKKPSQPSKAKTKTLEKKTEDPLKDVYKTAKTADGILQMVVWNETK